MSNLSFRIGGSPGLRTLVLAGVALLGVVLGGCSLHKKERHDSWSGSPQVGAQTAGRLPPPPSNSAQPIPQYPDWLFDGPEGRGFAQYLAQGYRRFAKQEDNEHDFRSAAVFLARAGQVERGERVEPEALFQRNIPPHAVSDLLYARHRLVTVFGQNAANIFPKIAAHAQVSFDCWMEQQEENLQPNEVAKCRGDFENDIVRLEKMLAPVIKPPAPPSQIPVAQVIAPVSCVQCPTSHLVFFDFNQASLTEEARKSITEIARTIHARQSPGIVVSGHTDLAGSSNYNDSLSKKRVDAVVKALIDAGVPSGNLASTYGYGKTRPRIPTPDGERNAGNRRVEVWLLCESSPMQGTMPAATSCPPAGVDTVQPMGRRGQESNNSVTDRR